MPEPKHGGLRECCHPCALVIFGANGDLTKRLVVPALYNLAKEGLLPENFALIGVDHGDKSSDSWRDGLRAFLVQTMKQGGGEFEAAKLDGKTWDKLASAMRYLRGDFMEAGTFTKLRSLLGDCDKAQKLDGNAVFYLAVPDRFFEPVIDGLAKAKLTEEDKGWRRVVVEKPFGHDLESAKALNAHILQLLKEDQVFRIDHFLGKETVQNIMAFRFANGLFEPIWSRDRIDHVQVTVAETVGVERRGNFYEATGCLRDMVPNHLFQLVAMTAMEPPVSFEAESVRGKKADVFHGAHPLKLEDVVRGQYKAGEIDGDKVQAYRDEPNVAKASDIETYVALKLAIDNWRWAGVPFYLRTGKRLSKRTTEIAIHFKPAPHAPFRHTAVDAIGPNWLVLQIQPDEGIHLSFNAKRPGPDVRLGSVAMGFKYGDWFKAAPAVGYETLLYDCFMGDRTLFQRADQVEAAWAVVDPVLQAWNKHMSEPHLYEAGSAGPKAADELLARDGRTWRAIA